MRSQADILTDITHIAGAYDTSSTGVKRETQCFKQLMSGGDHADSACLEGLLPYQGDHNFLPAPATLIDALTHWDDYLGELYAFNINKNGKLTHSGSPWSRHYERLTRGNFFKLFFTKNDDDIYVPSELLGEAFGVLTDDERTDFKARYTENPARFNAMLEVCLGDAGRFDSLMHYLKCIFIPVNADADALAEAKRDLADFLTQTVFYEVYLSFHGAGLPENGDAMLVTIKQSITDYLTQLFPGVGHGVLFSDGLAATERSERFYGVQHQSALLALNPVVITKPDVRDLFRENADVVRASSRAHAAQADVDEAINAAIDIEFDKFVELLLTTLANYSSRKPKIDTQQARRVARVILSGRLFGIKMDNPYAPIAEQYLADLNDYPVHDARLIACARLIHAYMMDVYTLFEGPGGHRERKTPGGFCKAFEPHLETLFKYLRIQYPAVLRAFNRNPYDAADSFPSDGDGDAEIDNAASDVSFPRRRESSAYELQSPDDAHGTVLNARINACQDDTRERFMHYLQAVCGYDAQTLYELLMTVDDEALQHLHTELAPDSRMPLEAVIRGFASDAHISEADARKSFLALGLIQHFYYADDLDANTIVGALQHDFIAPEISLTRSASSGASVDGGTDGYLSAVQSLDSSSDYHSEFGGLSPALLAAQGSASVDVTAIAEQLLAIAKNPAQCAADELEAFLKDKTFRLVEDLQAVRVVFQAADGNDPAKFLCFAVGGVDDGDAFDEFVLPGDPDVSGVVDGVDFLFNREDFVAPASSLGSTA